jgi:hypothetical protein
MQRLLLLSKEKGVAVLDGGFMHFDEKLLPHRNVAELNNGKIKKYVHVSRLILFSSDEKFNLIKHAICEESVPILS